MKGSRLTAQAAFLLLAATASASAQTTPPAELRAKFEKRVQEISSRVDGVVGYSIVDLASGERIGHLESASFPTASAIKLAIVYELFKQADEKRIDLEEKVTLDRRQAVGGTGVLVEMGTPTLSIRDYAVLMVTLSDNTATNVLIDRLGMDRIAARMQGLGLNGTKLRRHMMDTAAARRGDENVSTPDELVRLLEAMHGPMAGCVSRSPTPGWALALTVSTSCLCRSSGWARNRRALKAPASGLRCRVGWPRRWVARFRRPIRRVADSPSRSTWRRHDDENQGVGDRRRTADPAGAADQLVGSRL